MRCRARVSARFASADAAERTRRALAADDDGLVTYELEDARLVAEAEADDPGRLLAILDDLLACLQTAEGVAGVVEDA